MIGIPRALYYFDYYPFWKTFLEGLGFQVIASPDTNSAILDFGLSNCVDGACLPLKAFFGHAQALVKLGLTTLFVPQIVSFVQGEYTCPQILGLPDLLAQFLPTSVEILSPRLSGLKGAKDLHTSYIRFGLKYAPERRVKESLQAALAAHAVLDGAINREPKPSEGHLRLLLLGPRYLTEDPFLNGYVSQNLKALGAVVLTPMALGRGEIFLLDKPPFWSEGMRSLATLAEYKTSIDGVISLSPFGCGAEALLAVLIEEFLGEVKIPRLSLHLDEHTSALGIKTRLEAFCDLLERTR